MTSGLCLEQRSIYSPNLRATTVGILIVVTLVAFESMGVAAALPTATRARRGLAAYGWAFSAFLAATIVSMVWLGQLSNRADSSSLQLADAVSGAVTTGLAGVLAAAAARGTLGYTSAFSVLDLSMAGLTVLGLSVAARARPAAN